MPRSIWKGAISFGLVHVPVALFPATREDDIDFDWLDKRSMDPVGYKRVNKRTGKEITKENIVKGVKQEDGDYVLLSDDEIVQAYPKTTQTIEIEAFVTQAEIPFLFLERPYYLEPIGKGAKVYALLREAMVQAGAIGIARVVMHTKEHLAALIPTGPALLLNTLRWPEEIRPWTELKFPPEGKTAAGLKDAELKMAGQLIEELTTEWKPDDYSDKFKEAVMALIAQKAEAGESKKVTPLEEADDAGGSSNVVDLTELLKRSLNKGKDAGSADDKAAADTKKSDVRTIASAKKKPAARKRA
jgi:DNA end-binding protein Ku